MERKTIGKFIASLRKANGYTQSELAEILGVSNKTISSWETDNSSPDLSILPAIADLFHVTCDELLRGEKKKEEIIIDDTLELSSKSQAIMKNLIKSYKLKYSNMVYISIGIFFSSLILILPSFLLNHMFTFVLSIIGFITYFSGIIFSIITWNGAKNKINDEDDNSEYLRFILKKKLLIQCMYSFFILSPIFCYLTNVNLKNNADLKTTNQDIEKLSFNYKLKKKLYIIFGILVLICIFINIVISNLPSAIFNTRYNFMEEATRSYEIEVQTNEKYGSIIYTKENNSFGHITNIKIEDDQILNIQAGNYRFNIYFGSYDKLKENQDFSQHGFDIKYTHDYEWCEIYYGDSLIIKYSLVITNKNTAYYSISNHSLYEFDNNVAAYNYDNGFKSNITSLVNVCTIISGAILVFIYFVKRKNIL